MPEDPSNSPTIREGAPPRPPAPEVVAALFPQLEILDVVGRGGMGVVYRARQRELDRLVALKLLPAELGREPGFPERFAREARSLARLQHPNIVTVHDSGRAGDLCYLIMEYVDGTNLRGLMDGARVEPAQALSIASALCDALQYAHEEGIMHRDIKPENILIDRRGRVKIADFGLAKLLANRPVDYTITAPHQILGTMHYMAPEQIERSAEVDQRADIYAVGVVLYELLTGELPIGRFPLPSERAHVDPRLDDIVLHALEKEPGRRYQRVSEIRTDVDRLAAAAASGAPPPAPAPPDRAAPSRPAAAWPGTPPPAPQGGATPAPAPEPAPAPAPARRFGTPARPFVVKSDGLAYLLWFGCVFGLFGLHRFYAGRWITGIIWLLTGGCCFIGQLVDLMLIPGMIRLSNIEAELLSGRD